MTSNKQQLRNWLAGFLIILSLTSWQPTQKSQTKVSFSEQKMLSLVNKARRQGCSCGDKQHPPAPQLHWNSKLARAAQKHANNMAKRQFFDHKDPQGRTAAQRIEKENYVWRWVGENIAMGPRSTSEVMKGWLNSPGHCSNIMNHHFTEMGAAISKDGQYWVQVFATPQ